MKSRGQFIHVNPTVDGVTMIRWCRRHRTVPLVAFVKGHLRVLLKGITKDFDGCKKMSLKKTKIMFPVFFSVLGSFKYLFWASLLCLLSLLFCPSQHPYRSALFGPSVHPFYSAAAAASPPKYNYL